MALYIKYIPRIKNIVNKLDVQYNRFGSTGYAPLHSQSECNTISEPISIKSHSILTARVMRDRICNNPIAIVSALLHDYGHFCHSDTPVDPASGVNDNHEITGADELKLLGFPAGVYMPIKYHVFAKRYMASRNSAYADRLTKGSKLSFKLQGGQLTPWQMHSFEQSEWFDSAIMLRLADDCGKAHADVNGTSILEEFGEELNSVLIESLLPRGWHM